MNRDCQKCGSPISESFKFCRQCGETAVPAPSPILVTPEPATSRFNEPGKRRRTYMRAFCASCQQEIPPKQQTCPSCGGGTPICRTFSFYIQGSQPEPYRVDFAVVGIQVVATCTCPAGTFGALCKHRIALLLGDVTTAVDPEAEDLALMSRLINETPVAGRLCDLIRAEKGLAAAQAQLKLAKKSLALAFARG